MKLGAPLTRTMIEPSTRCSRVPVPWEVSMLVQSSPVDTPVLPAQVWTRLATDLQERAIRLMAQLAFNLVAAQSEWPRKESDHALPTQRPQNPA